MSRLDDGWFKVPMCCHCALRGSRYTSSISVFMLSESWYDRIEHKARQAARQAATAATQAARKYDDHDLSNTMPPRQRATSLTIGGDSLAGQVQASQADTGKRKRVGACARCRAHKVKCEVLPGTKVCCRCEQSGLSDICGLNETTACSMKTSALPSEPRVTQGKRRSRASSTSRSSIPPTSQRNAHTSAESQPKVSTKDQRIPENMGASPVVLVAPSGQKRSTILSTLDDTQNAYLDSIAELDEAYGPTTFNEDNEAYGPTTFNEDDEDMDIPMFPAEAIRSADQLLSVMTTGTSEPECMDLDDEGQSEMSSENFNLDDVQGSSNDEDSDIALDNLLHQRRPSKPVAAAAPQARRKHKQQTAKTAATSDDDDGRLQDLIVPGHLPSGRKSTRAPKNPVVQFEDAASLGNSGFSRPGKGGAKGSNTTSGVASKQKTASESVDPELDGAGHRLKLIKKLQERWKCDIHSKGTDRWCYSPSGGNMEGLAMIDEKPVRLALENAPHARSSSNQQNGAPMGQPSFPVGYRYPGCPPPIFVLPQWGAGPQGTGLPGQLSAQSGLSAPTSQNVHSVSPAPGLLKPVPDLIEWFSYLDTHGGRNKDRVVYSQFGPVLRAKGFYRLNHLSRKYIQLSELQDWLDIEIGTAINIFEYAEDDLEAARAGTLVLPSFGTFDDE
ncbi:hypothetical protein HD554DRAFT_2274127 [Boletus coccyginus]|nr:hypothetical protein HD554DRAFT_2274127 [Boletus coccyginus]